MWPKKVIVHIEGGLGNQLFQYAAARSLADRLGCALLLDLRGLIRNGDRPYMLDRYCIRAEIASSEELAALPPWRSSKGGRLRSRLSQMFPKLTSYPLFWPKNFSYDPSFERISRPVFMVGYWQSEKYFSWNRDRLLDDFTLSPKWSLDSNLLESFDGIGSVALHIRRGDYVSNKNAAKFHGICGMEYYQAAVRDLTRRIPEVFINIFSDDPDWVRRNLHLEVPMRIVDVASFDEAHIDMELMTRCHHHVIANSSYSWWGAWRCRVPKKIVYAPKRWFQDAETDTTDVVPVDWIRLD